jgi:hypothetical protein
LGFLREAESKELQSAAVTWGALSVWDGSAGAASAVRAGDAETGFLAGLQPIAAT